MFGLKSTLFHINIYRARGINKSSRLPHFYKAIEARRGNILVIRRPGYAYGAS